MTAIKREERIGGQRLILGDCLEVMPELGRFDAVVTSPPYGQQRDYGAKINDWRGLVSGTLLQINHGSQILCNLGLIHRDGRVCRYWDDLIADMESSGWRLFAWYVWDHGSGIPGDFNGRLGPSHEFIFHFNVMPTQVNKTKKTKGGVVHGSSFRKKDGTVNSVKSHNGAMIQPFKIPDSVIRTPRETSPKFSEHPARFSIAFASELIEPFSDTGDSILDPFMGSGTTLVACQKLGRRGTGIEINPEYFEIACKRVDEASRQKDLFIAPPETPTQEAMDL